MEPLYCDGEIVGQASSGGYGFRCGKSLALAYIDSDKLDADLTVRVLGTYYPATRIKGVAYDPKGVLLKSDT